MSEALRALSMPRVLSTLRAKPASLEEDPLTPELEAEFRARAAQYPQPFDVLLAQALADTNTPALPPERTVEQALADLTRAWTAPASLPDAEQARPDLGLARQLGTFYYQHGSRL